LPKRDPVFNEPLDNFVNIKPLTRDCYSTIFAREDIATKALCLSDVDIPIGTMSIARHYEGY
jgi:hypothetical protein